MILMIPAVVLSTGLFILFMPFTDVFALGPWLVVLVNALMALPYVLRTLSAPCNWWCASTIGWRTAWGARPASPAPGGMAPAAPSAGPGHGALDDIVPRGSRGHRHVRQPDPHYPALAALSTARQLPADRGRPPPPCCCSPSASPCSGWWSGDWEAGMWITDPRRHCRLPCPQDPGRARPWGPLGQSLTLPFINFSYLLFYKTTFRSQTCW